MNKTICFLDLETTGLEPSEGHVIASIGAVAVRNVKKDPIKEFYVEVTPTPEQWGRANPRALEVNGFTYDRLVEQGKPLREAAHDFLEWLVDNGVVTGKAVVVGHNPGFDLKFLYAYLGTDLEFINFPTSRDDVIDIRELYDILVNRRVMPYLSPRQGGRSAKNIARVLRVEEEPVVHNALEGARLAQRNYDAIMAMLKLDTPQ